MLNVLRTPSIISCTLPTFHLTRSTSTACYSSDSCPHTISGRMDNFKDISDYTGTARSSLDDYSSSNHLLKDEWRTASTTSDIIETSSPMRGRAHLKQKMRSTFKLITHLLPWVLLGGLSVWNLKQYRSKGPNNPIFPQLTYSKVTPIISQQC